MGEHGIPRGRRLGSDELQVVILSLLAEQPAHGYELMRTLEERSGGFYAPSPGMVYPALTYLEEIGYAAVTQDANRKLYSITDSGLVHLEANGEHVTAILETLKRIGGRMAAVREAYAGLGDADPDASDELSNARHALKHALMRKRGSAPEELRRVARVLENAAAEISKERERGDAG
jgi:DNA-binding PadR family transcriptional regulator